ncbi:uracil-DNA glycosylase [Rhizorhabdus dicambivorans]|uniref:Uracil-DNA glycosylase n=2 Tax=Rhizorhabdus dicambivorans TaxID=1850238 RepID=A0A2A4FY37_9SPHN|nr:uracil-DNA glycosylase [Rhizorhabdus dicambivorans]PCE42618.1 uracil-DNA glycosylase [Rhizorhabdus dicambivorans]
MGWWHEAGLDTLIDETPRDWLAKAERPAAPILAESAAPAPAAPAVRAEPPRAAPPAAPSFPDDLAAFQTWLTTSEALAMPLAGRVAPMGDPASGLMVLVDLPEAGDPEAGRLLSGPEGALLDAMIGAMKRDRQSLYLSAMAPGRPTGGYIDKAAGALFNDLARHHVALARPRALLLMGEAPSRAFLNLGFVEARGRVHDVQLSGGATQAVATFHPRTLLQHPQQKRRAWEDLQLLMKLLG